MNTTTLDTMPLVGSILHPTDLEFSQVSERAFAHALAISLLGETKLTILHVGPEHQSNVEWTNYPSVRQTLIRWGLLDTGSPQSAVFDKFQVQVRKMALRSRHPVKATTSFLDHEPTDLIVLATEGREGATRWLNRSYAEKIARWSRTMTLFVSAESKRNLVSLKDGKKSLQNILIPVDWQPDFTGAVEIARRTAAMLGDGEVAITLLHIGDSQPVLPLLQEGTAWNWQVETRQGEPVAEILSAAEKYRADLIVMATAGHEGMWDALRGSTTEQVLRKAPCPLLAVPANRKF